jgi:ankyrin repeat protein
MQEIDKQRNRNFKELVFSDIESALKEAKQDPSLLNIRNGIGETVFHYVIVENRIDLAEKLLKAGSDINTVNNFQQSPLIEAVELGYLEMVKWLVHNGADLNLKDNREKTAISEATKNDREEIFNFLIFLPLKNEINFYYNDFSAQDVFDNKNLVMREKLLSLGLKQRYS